MANTSQWTAPLIVGRDGTTGTLERLPLAYRSQGAFDESWLQSLIHGNVDCLSIDEIEPGLKRFSAICREMPTPRGPIDLLLMNGTGDIAIVETKLYRNSQARREVLAQLLDYATALFGLKYTEFERLALSGIFPNSKKPKSLYEAVPDGEKVQEWQFEENVKRNLRLGRAILLIVGDGIRSETDDLLTGIQKHARFGFTFGLIELAIFKFSTGEQYLIQPRILAKTEIIQRTIVEIHDGAPSLREERLAVPESIGVNAYWDKLEAEIPGGRAAVEKLLKAAEPLGIYPDFMATLNLKWPRQDKPPVNLGNISTTGKIATESTSWTTPPELARSYVEDLCRVFGAQCKEFPKGRYCTPQKDGKPLMMNAVLPHLNDWIGPMERFINAIKQHDLSLQGTE